MCSNITCEQLFITIKIMHRKVKGTKMTCQRRLMLIMIT